MTSRYSRILFSLGTLGALVVAVSNCAGGTTVCGANPCGGCPDGLLISPADSCGADGKWQCGECVAPDGGGLDAGRTDGAQKDAPSCGPSTCEACNSGCTANNTCQADGGWSCVCYCAATAG